LRVRLLAHRHANLVPSLQLYRSRGSPHLRPPSLLPLFLFNATATTETYTLSLHDALPIYSARTRPAVRDRPTPAARSAVPGAASDRKSTRLNSSHVAISYAVFCLKKKSTAPAAGVGRADQPVAVVTTRGTTAVDG